MHIFKEIEPLRRHLGHQRQGTSSIGLVPTMGALHLGHRRLIELAKRDNNITVCSIYVNPTQFNRASDLQKYPRTPESDIQMLEATGCDVLFCPENSEMYPTASELSFDFGTLGKILEGEFRPGHFSGVALVVSKLFNIVRPDMAYFGQKDFQQFKVVSRLVEELRFDLSLVCVPIVREADGLAMSSRNMRLNAAARSNATVLHQCLQDTRQRLLQGTPLASLREDVRQHCLQKGVKLEYLALADRVTFELLEQISDPSRCILLMAAYVGEIRLIDNVYVSGN